MSDKIRIICPDTSFTREERIEGLFNSCFDWIYSEEFRSLVRLFDGEELEKSLGKDRAEDIKALHEFVERWDARKGKERGAVVDTDFVRKHRRLIMKQADALGMIDVLTPKFEPDYILPLGGARMSNLDRTMMARTVIDKYDYRDKLVAALSAQRARDDINLKEKNHWKKYAEGAKTEYEAISCGLEKAFGVVDYNESIYHDSNINLCTAVRQYKDKYNGTEIYSLAAPSSDPLKRRANSNDTFIFFEEKFNIEPGKKLLLITSSIYVHYQYLAFMKLAINKSLDVDIIGSLSSGKQNMSKPSNYLQEMKGTIDMVYRLYNEYVIEAQAAQ